MKDIKYKKMYGWKQNLMYYIRLPKYLLIGLWLIITRNPIDEEEPFTWRDKIKLVQAFCDAKVGRYYKMECEQMKYDKFTKKCFEAKKLQELWKPETGDRVYSGIKGEIVVLYWSDHHGCPPTHYTDKRTATWLPRQDQLCKIVNGSILDFHICPNGVYGNIGNVKNTAGGGTCGENIEEVLLELVMMYKFKKVWNEQEEEWEDLEEEVKK